MSHAIQLIVGLGNPGKEYMGTRHNAGVWMVSHIASALQERGQGQWQTTSKLQAMTTSVQVEQHDCRLLLPTTYMNLSGQSVLAAAQYYKISPEHILVIHDDVDLPVGAIKIKIGGGHGGHNGLRDIDAKLGTQAYTRIRIGVGRPARSKDVVDYVLHAPTQHELHDIEQAILKACSVLPLLLAGEINKAMQYLHTEETNIK